MSRPRESKLSSAQCSDSGIESKTEGDFALYFDPDQETYYPLIPPMITPETLQKFDFRVWETIPDEVFSHVLFRLLNQINIIEICALLDKIPSGKIIEMTRRGYVTALKQVKEEERKIFIKDKIFTIVFSEEVKKEKKEKDEKRIPGTLFQHKRDSLLLDKLLLYVVRGEEKEAEAIIRIHPRLLLDSGTVMDYSGRGICGTALQIALGAGDVEMCQMIIPYLSEDDKVRQYQKQFQFPTDGRETQTKEIEALEKVTKIFLDAAARTTRYVPSKFEFISNLDAALAEFRSALKPKDVITHGKHFNDAVLLRALELHDYYFLKKKLNNGNIFTLLVIGYIQRYLPACYAQAWCQEFKDSKTLARSLKLKSAGYHFFPLDPASDRRLGFDYVVSCDARVDDCQWDLSKTTKTYKRFCQKKQAALEKIMHSPGKCLVM